MKLLHLLKLLPQADQESILLSRWKTFPEMQLLPVHGYTLQMYRRNLQQTVPGRLMRMCIMNRIGIDQKNISLPKGHSHWMPLWHSFQTMT